MAAMFQNMMESLVGSATADTSSMSMLVKDVVECRKPLRLVERGLEAAAAAAASGRCPNSVVNERHGSRTPLLTAADVGRVDIVNLLLSHGADTRMVDTMEAKTALHLACDGLTPGHIECALALVEAGAPVNARDGRGLTPLHLCCKRSDTSAKVVARLLDAGADPNIVTASTKRNCVHYAASFGASHILAMLASCGGSITATDRYDMTPLHTAVAEGRLICALSLARLGADVWAKDWRGWSCVELATRHGETPLALALQFHARMEITLLAELLRNDRARPLVFTEATPHEATPHEATAQEATAQEATTHEATAQEATAGVAVIVPAAVLTASSKAVSSASIGEATAHEAAAAAAAAAQGQDWRLGTDSSYADAASALLRVAACPKPIQKRVLSFV